MLEGNAPLGGDALRTKNLEDELNASIIGKPNTTKAVVINRKLFKEGGNAQPQRNRKSFVPDKVNEIDCGDCDVATVASIVMETEDGNNSPSSGTDSPKQQQQLNMRFARNIIKQASDHNRFQNTRSEKRLRTFENEQRKRLTKELLKPTRFETATPRSKSMYCDFVEGGTLATTKPKQVTPFDQVRKLVTDAAEFDRKANKKALERRRDLPVYSSKQDSVGTSYSDLDLNRETFSANDFKRHSPVRRKARVSLDKEMLNRRLRFSGTGSGEENGTTSRAHKRSHSAPSIVRLQFAADTNGANDSDSDGLENEANGASSGRENSSDRETSQTNCRATSESSKRVKFAEPEISNDEEDDGEHELSNEDNGEHEISEADMSDAEAEISETEHEPYDAEPEIYATPSEHIRTSDPDEERGGIKDERWGHAGFTQLYSDRV